MSRGRALMQRFEPTSRSRSSNVYGGFSASDNDLRHSNSGSENQSSVGDFDQCSKSFETTRQRQPESFRDGTGVSPSLSTIDRSAEASKSDADVLQRKPASNHTQSVPNSGLLRTPDRSRANNPRPSVYDVLPPGFSIPKTERSDLDEPMTISMKTCYQPIIRPISTHRSFIPRRKHQDLRVPNPDIFKSTNVHDLSQIERETELEPKPEPQPEIKPEIGPNPEPEPTPEPRSVQKNVSIAFRVRDTEMVEKYWTDKFSLLQQQSCKKVAKAWIRAICPRKQARFPYCRYKKSGAVEGEKPPWWPPSDVCQHKEPDHVVSRERIALLIYLLRLRPCTEELKEWREEDGDRVQAKHGFTLPRPGEWTDFLKRLTPMSLFDEVTSESKEKANRRPELLYDIFRVADLEEQMALGGSDGTDKISWTPSAHYLAGRPLVPIGGNRKRRSANEQLTSALYDAAPTIIKLEIEDTDRSTGEEPHRSVKRPRREVEAGGGRRLVSVKTMQSHARGRNVAARPSPTPTIQTPSIVPAELPERRDSRFSVTEQGDSGLEMSNDSFNSSANASLTTSFNSTSSADSAWSNEWDQLNDFQRHHRPRMNGGFGYPPPQITAAPGLQYHHGPNLGFGANAQLTDGFHLQPYEGTDRIGMCRQRDTKDWQIHNPSVPSSVPRAQYFPSHADHDSQQDRRLAASSRWDPMNTGSNMQSRLQPPLTYTDAPYTQNQSNMPTEQEWPPDWNNLVDLQQPHGLPMPSEDQTPFDYPLAGASLPRQYHHFFR